MATKLIFKTTPQTHVGKLTFGDAPSVPQNVKRWNGTDWNVAEVKRWDGTTWNPAVTSRWDGSNWNS